MVGVTRPAMRLAVLLTTVALPGLAMAQSVSGDLAKTPDSNFARDRNVSVRERPHPEYEAEGVRLGAFMAYPRLENDLVYDDNILAGPSKTSDTIWRVRPELNIESTWSRHRLAFFASATADRYSQNSNENTTDSDVGQTLRLDFGGRMKLGERLEHAELTEPRTSINGNATVTDKPVRYSQDGFNLGLTKEFNRLKLSGSADWERYDYKNGAHLGAKFLEDDRDRTATDFKGRADYAVSPDTAVFLEVTGNKRDYRLTNAQLFAAGSTSFTRDSTGLEALVGANFELTHVVRGEIGVGALRQNYSDGHFKDISSLGYRGKVEWFPTQLTTLTLAVTHSVEDSGIATSAGYLLSKVDFQVDHELMRNVILSGMASYSTSDFKDIDRNDRRWQLSAGATYLLNRRVGLNVNLSHLSQTSNGLGHGVDFDDNRLGAALILQF